MTGRSVVARSGLAVAALVLAAVLVGCGDDADVDDAAGEVAPASTVAATSTRATAGAGPAAAAGAWWRPAPDSSWQWQLSGEVNTGYEVDVYDIDLFDSDAELIAELHAAGRRVICYFSAGSAENWREDFEAFPEEDAGEPLEGWEGERWVDIRSPQVHAIMLARLDRAGERRCDGVEPDNVQSYDDETGFELTYADQLAYNRLIATEAHARGLAVGLKNGGAQVPDLLEAYDFALNEECHEYEECADFAPFVEAGKAVFNVEYRDSRGDALDLAEAVCPRANAAGLRTLILPLDLDDAFRVSCFD